MKLTFPAECKNEASRLSFAYRAQELLRQEHNAMGKKFRTGQITKAEWDDYLRLTFEPRSAAIASALLQARQDAFDGAFWKPDLDRDIA